MSKALLKINNLDIAFPQAGAEDKKVVHQLNLELQKGESLGIVGESGSGKSMTALSIMQLLPKTAKQQGQVLWHASTDLSQLSNTELRQYRGQKIGMIFQEPLSSLNPVLTCGDQISEILITHFQYTKKEAYQRSLDWFAKVHLPETERIFKSYPHQLSGGQRQRVMIAMALCAEPELLICDEPTTALDVTVQLGILDLLTQLKEEMGLSIIFISHDLGVIRKIAERVLIMQKGKVVEEGLVTTIFEQAQQSYTRGLLYCKPPMQGRLRRLATVEDFLSKDEQASKAFLQNLAEAPQAYAQRQQFLKQQDNILSVEALSVRFVKQRNWYGKVKKELTAVNQVSLLLKKGESLGLVGESGSGKTTFGKAILKLVNAQAGQVRFKGAAVLEMDEKALQALRPKMQMVFQDPFSSLNPKMTIGAMLAEPLDVHTQLSTAEKKERIIELIQKVGLDESSLSRYAHEFSGGQRQRIGLARALLLRPELLICDESVSALDVSVQAQVLNLIKDLQESYQFSLIFITHDLSVVKFIADRICVMQNGKIVEQAPTEELFAAPKQAYTRKLLNAVLLH